MRNETTLTDTEIESLFKILDMSVSIDQVVFSHEDFDDFKEKRSTWPYRGSSTEYIVYNWRKRRFLFCNKETYREYKSFVIENRQLVNGQPLCKVGVIDLGTVRARVTSR